MNRNYSVDEIVRLATEAVRAGHVTADGTTFEITIPNRGYIAGQNDSGSADGFMQWEIDGVLTDLWTLWDTDPDAPDPFDSLPEDVVKMLEDICSRSQHL